MRRKADPNHGRRDTSTRPPALSADPRQKGNPTGACRPAGVEIDVDDPDVRIPDGLFERAVGFLFDAFMITTAESGYPIIFVNSAFTAITGYTLKDLQGKSPRVLQGPHTDRSVLDRCRSTITDGRIFHGETINYRKDGGQFIMEWRIVPYRNPQGRITHFLAIQRDVTMLRAVSYYRPKGRSVKPKMP